MSQLVETIEKIRAKLPEWRRKTLNEAQTCDYIVRPLLQALGYDTSDDDTVVPQYGTIHGKFVDYALKIGGKVVLLIEAKPVGDDLEDLKGAGQVVDYAANEGVVWCVLTNGVRWKVFRSVERCPTPEKLMFEVLLDPRDTEGLSVGQIAEQMWRFSHEEMAKGSLDAVGERTFTDGKVRKALDSAIQKASGTLIRLVRKELFDGDLPPQKIKESLARIWPLAAPASAPLPSQARGRSLESPSPRSHAAVKAWKTRRGKKPKAVYEESVHTTKKPQEVLELYHAIERFCFSLGEGIVQKQILKKCITYSIGVRAFCSVHLQQSGLRVWLWLKYSEVETPAPFVRDVSNVGHWGGGDVELALRDASLLEQAYPLIRKSFDKIAAKAGE